MARRKCQYCIGIDLGTTNIVLAYAPVDTERAEVKVLPIPQLTGPATVEPRDMLPAFLYVATPEEAAAGSFSLPWAAAADAAVGDLARRQAAEVPARTVAGAKSWLCHSRVDRHQPILPWNAPDEVAKVSPVAAATRYLAHLAAAWEQAFPDAPLAAQSVVLTVPASFDASARELTREAALAAGLPEDLVLLEEPQAALYAWLADRGDGWRRELTAGDTLLVCDVGGGTTDFSLIGVEAESGDLVLRRLAVGNHILVGGDNMDLTLAHAAREKFAEKGVDVDPWQAIALWHACRNAKEALLDTKGPDTHPVTVLGRGRSVVAKTISVPLAREQVMAALADGFFPLCGKDDRPQKHRVSGFREVGLPYESDTAVTRHLAQFLGGCPERPTHLLFNGGVFKAPVFQERIVQALTAWYGQEPRALSGNVSLDFAVARGAAYYGAVKRGRGIRIRGGTARAYYLGIETAGLAVPGAARPLRALCVAAHGMEEGSETEVPGPAIGLVVGEPARFRFFSSTVRREDKPGALLDRWQDGELEETDSMEATLPPTGAGEDDFVEVRFHSDITELGMLQLWCVATQGDGRWKLEFSVREDAAAG